MDVCQNLSSQPRFRSATRMLILSRTTAPDFLSAAALAGVAEVIGKPVDMNQLIGQVGEKKRMPVAYDDIPPLVVQAFLAAEDDRFFEHPGFDYQGIVRAAVKLITTGSPGNSY